MAKKKISKPVAKKKAVAPKKKSPVKVVQKKKGVKAPIAKKAAVKKTVIKKTVIKKTVPESKNTSPKAVVKKKAIVKKVIPVKVVKPKPSKAAAVSTPLIPELIIQNDTIPEVKSEDPLMSFDKHAFQKATTKGDPHSKLHLNNTGKSAIRPSGKKPLWRK